MSERELDDIASKMPSDRSSSSGSSTGRQTEGRRTEDDVEREEYSDEARSAISDLTSTDESRRLEASYSLDLGDEDLLGEIEAGLRDKLEDEDPDVRAAAARSLGEVGSGDSVDALRDASKDKVRAVSNAATEALREVVNSDGRRLSRDRRAEASDEGSPVDNTSGASSDAEEGVSADGVGGASETDDGRDGGHAAPDTSTEEAVKGPVHGETEEEPASDRSDAGATSDEERSSAGTIDSGSGPEGSRETSAVGISDAVVLRLAESGNDGVAELVESSLRRAVESYPEVAEQELERYVEMLSDDRDAVRRHGSRFLSAVSEAEPSLVERKVDAVVDALDDADEVVRRAAEEALKNLAEQSPETLAEMVVEAKKDG